MRHSPEDHLVEQILGLGKGLVAGLTLALSVRQVGEIDDETAFFGRDQIDRPCRQAEYLFHPSLLSQIADRQAELPQDGVQQAGLQLAAAGRDMSDAIATFDPDLRQIAQAKRTNYLGHSRVPSLEASFLRCIDDGMMPPKVVGRRMRQGNNMYPSSASSLPQPPLRRPLTAPPPAAD